MAFLVICVLAYLIGSIPSSVWVGKIYKGIDVRDYGSGNAGATNTFRVLGWKAGVIVVIMDFVKGFTVTVYISKLAIYFGGLPEYFMGEHEVVMSIIVGIIAVVGHTLPVWAQFRGGKGMLTAGGMLYGVEPISITITILMFILVISTTRYASLASIMASLVYPIILVVMKFFLGYTINPLVLVIAFLLCGFLLFKHKTNITRLLNGTETKVGSNK
ncbi:MAG: glycerol-3-phosphate 1-O-acyltransferase PlsY [Bacteroidetes bacterium]|nr:glycerol-3-phosphate 1-O-acyltransferase PlsY [Bacteroidota bacterium]